MATPESTRFGCTPKGPAKVSAVCPESGVRPERPKGPVGKSDNWPRLGGTRDHRQGEPQVRNIQRYGPCRERACAQQRHGARLAGLGRSPNQWWALPLAGAE